MFPALLTGLGTGLALIVAIGAQNAFLLRQGIRGEHVGAIIAVCLTSDLIGITAGVAGFGVVLDRWPGLVPVAQIAGGIYLIGFGAQAAYRAWKPGSLEATAGTTMTKTQAVLTALALTWLNPHFYLDTLLMLGAIAGGFGAMRWWFLLGALIASTVWFFSLGYGARLLRGFFARPKAWRALDTTIAVVMGGLGLSLLLR